MHTPTAAVIRLREDAFSAWAASRGLETASAAADALGISHTTLTRVLSGDIKPGEQFIASALAATGAKFEELFEVTG